MVTPIVHELKILPRYFDAQIRGLKNFEIRENDRNYRTGDYLLLNEWNGHEYTGRSVEVYVTFITDYAQQPGWVVLGTSKI